MKDGFVLINKEKNISSSKIDYYLKKTYSLNKCGHLGTLDPLAEGLLVVAINKATKLFKYFEGLNKAYILRIRLGATSLSLDYEKEIIDKIDTNLANKVNEIDNALISFKKKYLQAPPIYSAIKYNGKKLYDYALKNENIEIKKREVEIYDIKRLSDVIYIDGSTYFDIYLKVSSGFYVRSFANDFAQMFNTIGMADNIRRIAVGPFKIEDSINKENFNEDLIISPLDYLNIKAINLNEFEYKKVINGIRMNFKYNDKLLLLKYNNENVAIYKKNNSLYEMDLLL